jgi:hypothetical protein
MKRIVIGVALLLSALISATPSSAGNKGGDAFFDMVVEMDAACDWGCTDWSGRFQLSGALTDRGSAFSDSQYWNGELMELDGKLGHLTIEITDLVSVAWTNGRWVTEEYTGTFRILAAAGAYASLEGLTGNARGLHGTRGKASHGDAGDTGSKPVSHSLTWDLAASDPSTTASSTR